MFFFCNNHFLNLGGCTQSDQKIELEVNMFFLQIYKPDPKKSWRFKDKLIRFDGQMTKVEVTMTSKTPFQP